MVTGPDAVYIVKNLVLHLEKKRKTEQSSLPTTDK